MPVPFKFLRRDRTSTCRPAALTGAKPPRVERPKPPPIFRPWRNAADKAAFGLHAGGRRDPGRTAAFGEMKFRGEATRTSLSVAPPLDRALPRLNDNKHLATTHGLSPWQRVDRDMERPPRARKDQSARALRFRRNKLNPQYTRVASRRFAQQYGRCDPRQRHHQDCHRPEMASPQEKGAAYAHPIPRHNAASTSDSPARDIRARRLSTYDKFGSRFILVTTSSCIS
jgi:hypothetical protein